MVVFSPVMPPRSDGPAGAGHRDASLNHEASSACGMGRHIRTKPGRGKAVGRFGLGSDRRLGPDGDEAGCLSWSGLTRPSQDPVGRVLDHRLKADDDGAFGQERCLWFSRRRSCGPCSRGGTARPTGGHARRPRSGGVRSRKPAAGPSGARRALRRGGRAASSPPSRIRPHGRARSRAGRPRSGPPTG